MSSSIPPLTRRDFLKAAAIVPLAAALPTWMPRLAFASTDSQPAPDLLVCIFLRGAHDGLNIVVPHFEDAYYSSRPNIAIARPNPSDDKSAIDLDGRFGFHPALAPLKDIFAAGHLAAVHAAGSPDPTRSHFDAQDYMERGTPGEKTIATGWIARHLEVRAAATQVPFRAVGMGSLLQESLRGPIPAAAMQGIADFHLKGHQQELARVQTALNALYEGPDWLDQQGAQAMAAMNILDRTNPAQFTPQHGAQYPTTGFGQGLKQVAELSRSGLGLEVACLDLGGWDTHVGEDATLANLLKQLAEGLAAFYTDLQDDMARITLVTMSEFGRRVHENGGRGTDHGHGNTMFLMGGNVAGGRVYGQWPGLAPDQLDHGDLAVTTDFRSVLGEIVQKRLLDDQLSTVFPGFSQPAFLGIVNG